MSFEVLRFEVHLQFQLTEPLRSAEVPRAGVACLNKNVPFPVAVHTCTGRWRLGCALSGVSCVRFNV